MQAYELLHQRVSVARLDAPGPDAAQLDRMFRAALRAPDHGLLRPWRFLTVDGEARARMGELFETALREREENPEQKAIDKARNAPLRAPLVVVVIASVQDHAKVPPVEQLLAAGCAAHGLVQAAYAEGLGAIWRSGDVAYDPVVLAGLGVQEHEAIVGYIYIGTPVNAPRAAPELAPADFVSAWSGR